MCASLDTLEEVLIVEEQKIELVSEKKPCIQPYERLFCILWKVMDYSIETGRYGGEIVSH